MAGPTLDVKPLLERLEAPFSLLRPTRVRLDIDLVGGSTRRGALRATLTNLGANAARGLRIDIHWIDSRGADTLAASIPVPDLAAGDLRAHLIPDLHRSLPDEASHYTTLRVRLRAWNAWPRAAWLPLRPRAGSAGDHEGADRPSGPYRVPDCPSGGRHRFERRTVSVDSVVERWDACANCPYATRLPLTPEEEARQREAREARRRREAQREAWEAARRAREESTREHARRQATRERARRRPHDAPPLDDDEPGSLAWAFDTLGLDPQNGTWDDVVAAHRRLALEHHPDRLRNAPAATREAALRRMQDVNRARDLLRKRLAPV